jgi:hypothetical protein
MGVDISFEDFINQLNLNFATYINFLCNRLTKPTLFLKRHMKDIKTKCLWNKIYNIMGSEHWYTIHSWPIYYNKLLHIISQKKSQNYHH